MKVLITGGQGFIGRNLAEALADDYEILAPKIDQLNLLDQEHVEQYLTLHHPDIVLHAAHFGERDGEVDAYKTLDHGLRMFFNLERCSDLYKRMYYFGSGAEYSKTHMPPFVQESYFGTYIPQDPYSFYKYVCAQECFKHENIYDLRLFGIYGKYELWNRRFISSNICRALKGFPLTLSKDMYFDYLYIDDFINIMRWFIENEPRHHHYNICRGEHVRLSELGNLLRSTLCVDLQLLIFEEGSKREYSGDNSRLRAEIGAAFAFTSYEKTFLALRDYYSSILDTIDETMLP